MDFIAAEQYYEIFFDEENKILVIKWKVKVLDISLLEYKEVMKQAYEYIDILQPEFLIQDGQDAIFPITDEANQWMVNNLSPWFASKGLKKIAYIVPRDERTLSSLKEIIDRSLAAFPQVKRALFSDYDKAITWIKHTD